MRTLLVTGSGGQVGSKLLNELAGLGKVVGIDVQDLDLTQTAAISAFVQKLRPAAIVNAAAYTAVDKAESEPETARKINADAVRTFGVEARKLKIPLVHYSTDYVFDGSGERPWNETDRTGPLGVYGQTKLEGEMALSASGCTHVVMRTSWVFSDHGHNFVKTMLRLGGERETLSVVSDQIGAPTSASTLARMTRLVLERAFATGQGFAPFSGLYHLTCAGTTSWHGFATTIFAKARALGFPLKVQTVVPITTDAYPTPAMRPSNSRLDCSKFIETFGVRPESWENALDETLQSLKKQTQS